jgi:hypothetical protein
MWTVISPLAETVARVTPRPFPHQPGKPVSPEPHLHAVRPHIDTLDQQLRDPRLLGREELVPQRVELLQGARGVVLSLAA